MIIKKNTRKKIEFTPEDIKQILNYEESGQQLADKFGCSKQVIHRVRREHGTLKKNETQTQKKNKGVDGETIFDIEKRLLTEGKKLAKSNMTSEQEKIALGYRWTWIEVHGIKARVLRKQ